MNKTIKTMKKSIFYYLFAVVCTVCLFTACSDDDDDNKASVSVDSVVGTYTGTLQVLDQSMANTSITLSKVDANTVKVELKDFSYSGLEIGDISANCTATLDADELDLYGTVTLTVAALGNIDMPIVIDGDVDASKLDIDINISNVPFLNSLKVEFEGYK